jgi:hypothetical protein
MYYFLTFLCGFFGVMASARSIERLTHGEPVLPGQILIALVGLSLAVLYLRKARAARKITE